MDHGGSMDHGSMDHGGSMGHAMANTTSNSMKMDHTDSMMDHGEMDPHAGHNMKKMDMDMGHSMKMYFHFDYNAIILFHFWNISTIPGLIGSMVGIFLMGTLYEGIKWFRLFLDNKWHSQRRPRQPADRAPLADNNGQSAIGTDDTTVTFSQVVRSNFGCGHLVQTVLYVVQLVVSYFLMLIFMTYNVWLCLAVALGSGFGHLLFAKRNLAEPFLGDHCH